MIAVRISETTPNRDRFGTILLPLDSVELFRRVATDSVTTPGLLPALEPGSAATMQAGG